MKPSDIITQYGWIQGAPESEQGFCLQGALYNVYRGHHDPWKLMQVTRQVQAVIFNNGQPYHKWASISEWNDTPGRTKRQVLAVLRKAGQ